MCVFDPGTYAMVCMGSFLPCTWILRIELRSPGLQSKRPPPNEVSEQGKLYPWPEGMQAEAGSTLIFYYNSGSSCLFLIGWVRAHSLFWLVSLQKKHTRWERSKDLNSFPRYQFIGFDRKDSYLIFLTWSKGLYPWSHLTCSKDYFYYF